MKEVKATQEKRSYLCLWILTTFRCKLHLQILHCHDSRLWVSFSVHACSVAQSCPTVCNPMDCSPPTRLLLSMEFSRQEYWSGVSFPPPGDLPNPGVGPASPALAGVPLRKPQDLLPHIALMYCFTLPQKSFHSDSCLASPNPRKVEKRRYCSFSFYRRIGH